MWRPRGVLINLRRCQFLCGRGGAASELKWDRAALASWSKPLHPHACYTLVRPPPLSYISHSLHIDWILLGDSPYLSSNLTRGDALLSIFRTLLTCGSTNRFYGEMLLKIIRRSYFVACLHSAVGRANSIEKMQNGIELLRGEAGNIISNGTSYKMLPIWILREKTSKFIWNICLKNASPHPS